MFRRNFSNDIARYILEIENTGRVTKTVLAEANLEGVYYRRQFLFACLVTRREIAEFDVTVLKNFRWHLQRTRRLRFHNGYLAHGRAVFLINKVHNNCNKHGEARLVDPDGRIRDMLAIGHYYNEFQDHLNYLEKMEHNFVHEFGQETVPYLLIFSNYIPCTIDGYHCAATLGMFAYIHNYMNRIFVGYREVYRGTNEYQSIQTMTNYNIGVVLPQQLSAALVERNRFYFPNIYY